MMFVTPASSGQSLSSRARKMRALQKQLYFLCILLLCLSGCKKEPSAPEAPALIRLSELMDDQKTEIDSHFTMKQEDLKNFQQHGWKISEQQVTATESRATFLLPQWLWKSRDFRMKFQARSREPRRLSIHVQGKEITKLDLTQDWKEYVLQYKSKDFKKPTVKQIVFLFEGRQAESYAEFRSFQLPLYSWGRTRIARDARSALLVGSKSKLRFHFRLPSKNPMLFFGLGVPVEKGAAAQVVYKVLIESKKGSDQLLQKSVQFPQPYLGWQDERIDLRKHAGEEVTLQFETRSSAQQNHYVAWSSPEIYDVEAKKTKPNIILLSIDTLRADRLSDRTAPNLMELARKSQVFTNAYCTFPSTLPSHVSVMTGLYVAHHQVSRPVAEIIRVKQIPAKLPTIAEIAQSAEYFTAGITDGGFVSSFFGFDRGFQQYSENIHIARQDVATISNGIQWLNKNSQRPFFLFLHSYEVHEPFNPPADIFRKLFPKPALNQPPQISMDWLDGIVSGKITPNAKQKEFIQQCYDAEVYFFDQNFGRLMSELKRLKVDENTVILIFGDHGELFLEQGTFGHGKTLVTQEIQVPLILHVPGGKAAQRNSIVSLVDIFPTLAEVMGAKLNAQLDGVSLVEPDNSKKRVNRPIYYEVTFGNEAQWGAQTHEFKLVLDKQKGTEYFYDLRKDPEQKNDLSRTGTRSLKMMKQLLAAYVQKSTSPTEWVKTQQQKQETNELREQLKALGYVN